MNNFYVYMYLRSNNSKNGVAGSPYYIGKGKRNRAFDKQHRCKPPSDKSKIIFISKNMSEIDAHQLEILLIYFYGRIDKKTGCLANLTDGGEGQIGAIQTPEANQKRRSFMKANPNRGNVICPKWPKGKPRAEETKAKQRAYWANEENRKAQAERMKGNTNGRGCKGRVRTEVQNRHHSEMMKGKPSPCGMRGKKHSPEAKLKISMNHKSKKLIP